MTVTERIKDRMQWFYSAQMMKIASRGGKPDKLILPYGLVGQLIIEEWYA